MLCTALYYLLTYFGATCKSPLHFQVDLPFSLSFYLQPIISKTKCYTCANVACEEDSKSCEKCNKKFHWKCSKLSDYEIKLHRKNPYKPWRCDHCRDKYCKHCNKTFSNSNYDSICCDKCSFWYHFQCSQLRDSQFRQICDNSDLPWKCPPCKRKLCVNCNSSTHNKPKISCLLCDKLYHNVCAGLPKAFKQTDWLCKSCRPSVFPFHNVDHKSLIKIAIYGHSFFENLFSFYIFDF